MRERVARIDSASGSGAGSGRHALVAGRELAIAWIAPAAALEAIASRDRRRDGSNRGQNRNGEESGD